jgi:hypothetical protein
LGIRVQGKPGRLILDTALVTQPDSSGRDSASLVAAGEILQLARPPITILHVNGADPTPKGSHPLAAAFPLLDELCAVGA